MATRRSLGLATVGIFAARKAAAQAEPTRLIVNVSPGGALDGTARLLAEHLAKAGRGSVVVDNRVGANGNIGATLAARSRPDGRTLLVSLETTMTVNPHTYRDVGFDPLADLVPVAHLGSFALVLLVHPSHPAADLRGFLDGARGMPAFYSSGGIGSPGHLAMEHLRQVAGLPAGALDHVPQRGNPEALAALVSGQVPTGFLAIGGGADFVRSGRLRPLAVSGAARNPLFPDVPTVAETGLAGFDVRIAQLLLAPRGTPEAAIADWAGLARAALAGEAARARFAGWGLDPPQPAVGGLIPANHAAWGRVVRDAGIRPE
jgi:tripartite-type tricarboxylate transporter receptor subunit TctC